MPWYIDNRRRNHASGLGETIIVVIGVFFLVLALIAAFFLFQAMS